MGAGKDTFMSISDEIGPSISCRKMKRTRLLIEEMDGKIVFFPPELAFLFFDVFMMKTLFPICTLTWRVNNYVSRQERV